METTGVTFKMDSAVLSQAKGVLKQNQYSLAGAMKLFLQQVAVTGQVQLPTVEELEREALFRQLQGEVKKAVDDYEAGVNYYTAKEVRERLGL